MAKKVVATLQKGATKNTTKVIKMVRSKETGSYSFKIEMVLNENVQDFFKKDKE